MTRFGCGFNVPSATVLRSTSWGRAMISGKTTIGDAARPGTCHCSCFLDPVQLCRRAVARAGFCQHLGRSVPYASSRDAKRAFARARWHGRVAKARGASNPPWLRQLVLPLSDPAVSIATSFCFCTSKPTVQTVGTRTITWSGVRYTFDRSGKVIQVER